MDILSYLEEQKGYLERHSEIVQEVIREQGRHTPELPTMGGTVFWNTVQIGPWKFQRHVAADICRILDEYDESLAYGTQEEFYQRFRRKIGGQQQHGTVSQRKYGIVFAGGGGKGAYQIGVWKYLHERGMDTRITGISGTSVGALNGLLFLQGDYDLAEKVWLDLKQETMFSGNILERLAQWERKIQRANVQKDVIKRGAATGLLAGLATTLLPGAGLAVGLSRAALPVGAGASAMVAAQVQQQFMLGLSERGILNQDGIEALIRRSIDWNRVKKQKKLFYCTVATTDLLDPAAEYRCLNGFDKEETINSVLQSASIPIIYGPRKDVRGHRHYVDGGTVDNTPIRPLLKDKYEEIIVIHLSPRNAENEEKWQQPLADLQYKKRSLHHVWPSEAFWEDFGDDMLGNARAIITVNRKINQKRMDIGYKDACKQLVKLEM